MDWRTHSTGDSEVYTIRLSDSNHRDPTISKMTGIRLGLSRITKLLKDTPRPWRAVHVAGTNGKGSVCNYVYHMLRESGVRCGMFTSPHLIDRWDCISINGSAITRARFDSIEAQVRARNQKFDLEASSFELLTATAFEAFTEHNVDIAVVETGMGGLEDATNIITEPIPAIITKLGLDHEDILGKGIENIVEHKAGIMKNRSPCLVDGTNSRETILFLEAKAKARGVSSFKVCNIAQYQSNDIVTGLAGWPTIPDHKRMHLILAWEAAKIALNSLELPEPDWHTVLKKVVDSSLPGRQQTISIQGLTGRISHVLLDGCHNEQSAEALEQEVAARYRNDKAGSTGGVVWILAFSRTKDIKSILNHLLTKGDTVIATEFGPVDGMPWVSPMPTDVVVKASERIAPLDLISASGVIEALHKATQLAEGRPLVIAGSLYLASDVLRLVRDADQNSFTTSDAD